MWYLKLMSSIDLPYSMLWTLFGLVPMLDKTPIKYSVEAYEYIALLIINYKIVG